MNAETETITAADLKARREAVGITQEQLANCIGYHRSGVSHWEQGHSPVRASEAPKVNAVLSLLTIVQWRERSAFQESRARLDEVSATLDRVTAQRDALQKRVSDLEDVVLPTYTGIADYMRQIGERVGADHWTSAEEILAKVNELLEANEKLSKRANHLLMRTEVIATERDEAQRSVTRLRASIEQERAEARRKLAEANTRAGHLFNLIRRRIEADTGELVGDTYEALMLWAQDVCPDPGAWVSVSEMSEWGAVARASFEESAPSMAAVSLTEAEAAQARLAMLDSVKTERDALLQDVADLRAEVSAGGVGQNPAETIINYGVDAARTALLSMTCKAVAEWAESGRPPMGQILAAAQVIQVLGGEG